MPLTHLFFDVHDVLIDSQQLSPCYAAGVGRVLSARYGGDPAAWADANRRILADWDSYYADLNLSGDEGMHDYYEGMFRTTRALFRLTAIHEPPHDELKTLSRVLPGLVTQGCDALYPDVRETLAQLHGMGLTLGVISSAPEAQVIATLQPVSAYLTGWISGADTADRFDKDEHRYLTAALRAGISPEACLVVDDKAYAMAAARQTGMFTAQCDRVGRVSHSPAHYLIRGLSELIPICEALMR